MAGFHDVPPSSIQVDPSAASFKVQLTRDGFHKVEDADNSGLDGIREVAMGFSTGALLIHESCSTLIEQILGYHWDQKAQAKGIDQPVKIDEHCCDALRYAVRKAMMKVPEYSFNSPGQISSSGIHFS
jgi:phage terminase large subunit